MIHHGTGAVVSLDFHDRDTVEVARDLVGLILVRVLDGERLEGRIVETEAYREGDPASHSFRGPTDRCRVMFGPPGVAYVYRSYGVHHCLNVVTEGAGRGCAVLIRAVEPLGGHELLWRRRFPGKPFDRRIARQLTNGPGKLTKAYAISVDGFNGHRLDAAPLYLCRPKGGERAPKVVSDVRVGITRGTDKRWRFIDVDSEFVSRRASALLLSAPP